MSDERTQNDEALGHEPIEADARAISYALGGMVVFVLVSLVVMGGLMALFTDGHAGEPTSGAVGSPIEPPSGVAELNPDQKAELRRLRAREREMLTEYAWIDEQARVARIPIGRAMAILEQPGATGVETQQNEDEFK